jgi:hypothetical protein
MQWFIHGILTLTLIQIKPLVRCIDIEYLLLFFSPLSSFSVPGNVLFKFMLGHILELVNVISQLVNIIDLFYILFLFWAHWNHTGKVASLTFVMVRSVIVLALIYWILNVISFNIRWSITLTKSKMLLFIVWHRQIDNMIRSIKLPPWLLLQLLIKLVIVKIIPSWTFYRFLERIRWISRM